MRGDRPSAAKNFDSAAVEFEKAVQKAPDAAERHANLRLCYAFMGILAIPLIDRLPRTPGAVDSADYSITVKTQIG
jgi:hypothetical protein